MEVDTDIIHLKVVDRSGKEHDLEAPTNMNFNVMEICKASGLDVEGTCGGMALCASCHVYIESPHQLPDPSEEEEDMLDQAFFVEDNSRLCCQIPISENLEGLKFKLAPVAD